MRHLIRIVEEASVNPIDLLIDRKEQFLYDIAMRAEEHEIRNLLPDYEGDETGLLDHYFDQCIGTFEFIWSRGRIPVYRMISVDDIPAFIQATMDGQKLGHHWTYDDSAPSVGYHHEEPKAHNVILCADAPATSIDFAKSLTAHFLYPNEHELYLDGTVKLESILGEHSYRPLATPNLVTQA